jgi:xanthine permease XanP
VTKKRPSGLIYGVDDVPPLLVTLLNATQQVAVVLINIVYPILIFRAANVQSEIITQLLAVGIFVLGVGTFVQSLRVGPVGSGYLCPATFTATYLAPSVVAVKSGGLPLVFGMTAAAGLIECAVAPLLHRLRAIFPPEISGIVIFMIGVSGGLAGIRTIMGPNTAPMTQMEWTVGAITLGMMVFLNIWGTGIGRMLCALIGLVIGYLEAAVAGLFTEADLLTLKNTAWLDIPHFTVPKMSFDVIAILPFAIAGIAAAMKAAGTITVCERANDAGWVRPNTRTITRGVLADGINTILAGIAGAVGTNTSTPAVGLSTATGVTSRQIAYATAVIFIGLSFCPKVTALFAVMPRPVIVAALLFAVAFITINGLQVMTSRLLDARRTLTIGLSLIGGLSIEVFPRIATAVPESVTSLAGSSMVFATVVALAMNAIFRIGVAKTADMRIPFGEADLGKIEAFFRKQCAAWGARPDIATKASFGTMQLVDAVADGYWRSGDLTLSATFDEFNLDTKLSYQGEPVVFPDQRPSSQEIRDSTEGTKLLAGFMMKKNADRVRSEQSNGMATVTFHFDH